MYCVLCVYDEFVTSLVFELIVRKFNRSGLYREHHAKKPMKSLESYFTDRRTHLYTLVLEPSTQRFMVLVDGSEVNSGSLLEDFEPPVVPDKEIVDPSDAKPVCYAQESRVLRVPSFLLHCASPVAALS